MQLKIQANRQDWGFRTFDFPSGESHLRLEPCPVSGVTEVSVFALIHTPNDVFMLLLCVDALKRVVPGVPISLEMPFVPCARQDRVAVPGEPLSVAVVCQLINAQGFSRVVISDPHSDVATALLNNVQVKGQGVYVQSLLESTPLLEDAVFVAPDAGARKRVDAVAAQCSTVVLPRQVVYASKKRNPVTGQLGGFSVDAADVPQKPLLVLDDICDGGGTFIGLAEELRRHTQQPLYLFVTHGLFTKGLQGLKDAGYAGVFCAYTMTQATFNEKPLTIYLHYASI